MYKYVPELYSYKIIAIDVSLHIVGVLVFYLIIQCNNQVLLGFVMIK
jgi:hypothetical protein